MIRVTRILEYTYEDNETAEQDMGRWYIPANGTRIVGVPTNVKSIRSATFINLFAPKEEPEL
jgi:hypothetical protein